MYGATLLPVLQQKVSTVGKPAAIEPFFGAYMSQIGRNPIALALFNVLRQVPPSYVAQTHKKRAIYRVAIWLHAKRLIFLIFFLYYRPTVAIWLHRGLFSQSLYDRNCRNFMF